MIGFRKGFFLFIFFYTAFASGQEKQEISLLFAGDVMSHGPQINAARNTLTDSYDYDAGFQFVKPIIEQHDISIANLEVTHAGKPYSGYPQFSAPEELSTALMEAGFDVLLTCNNHSCDGGAKGVIRTLDVLDKLGIQHTGTFRNKAERDKNYPLILNQNGMKMAILNYTFSTNGISVAAPLIINYIDSAVIKKDVEKAKKLGAEYVICALHWGTEYQSLPNAYQKNWEKYCYDLGVDMVIGSHPHVIQPLERKIVNKEEKLTVYSLGNYVSNQRDRYKNGGLMVGATLQKVAGKIEIKEVHHSFAYVHTKQEQAVKYYYILPEFDYTHYRADFMNATESASMREFFADSRQLFSEHSIGSQEYTVTATSEAGIKFQQFLSGYYAILLEERKDIQLPAIKKTLLAPSVLKVIQSNGSYAFVYGMFATIDETKGEKRFLEDCGFTPGLKIVFVSPKEFKYIEE
jgi:poly-gamma-glutamate capsule biosynthesis protein CapA/YwtB (metallophosphatase superfamily)